MFSVNFTDSAVSVDETGITSSTNMEKKPVASSSDVGSSAPTTLGVLLVLYSLLPGSRRSGENARKTSRPGVSPRFIKIGAKVSRVVPGKVVDCRMTSCPGREWLAIELAACTINERSGPPNGPRGVCTQMIATSTSLAREKSAVGTRRSVSTSLAIDSDGTCSRYDRPSASILTRRASTSKPMTLSFPLSAAARASSSPVEPSPNTPATALRLWIRFHALVYAGLCNMLNTIVRGASGHFT